jgi:hypothetical protein
VTGSMTIHSVSVLAVLVLMGSGSLLAQNPPRGVPKEFDHVRTLGRALSEFQDDRIQVVAAYYYSQYHHDQPWLLIEIGAFGRLPTKIDRRTIGLVTPSSRVVPLASQSRWGQAGPGAALLLQQARTTRHQVAWYFKAVTGEAGLRFFVWPNGAGTVRESIDLMPYELVRGDLLFESPTRLGDEGTYALVIGYEGREAVLPIELR